MHASVVSLHSAYRFLVTFIIVVAATEAASATTQNLGRFSAQTDIGETKTPGTCAYDAAKHRYLIGSSGANMWGVQDAFHYVWKKTSGDIALSAQIDFVGTSPEPHRKACIIIRQTLEADSVHVNATVHGDGLTSLQFRDELGGITREVQARISAPRQLRLEKIKDTVYLSVATEDGHFTSTGCSVRVPFAGEYYIGIGVCAHNAEAYESALFSQVTFSHPSKLVTAVRSSLETIVIASKDRRSVYHSNDLIEAPNWSRDGASLYYNGGGHIYRLPLSGPGAPENIDTGFAVNCNNDHGLSPDGSQLVISDQTKPGGSRIYVLPVGGGTPRAVTPLAPSYWHGWSPDGLTLAYCAQREGKFGIFTIPAQGGEEKRLTTTDGLDDGPDYSPDGEWIYFNSDRCGRMQIWRMHPDGTATEQVTDDEYNNWFAHPSPNGKWLVFLSYSADVKGHPPDKEVELRLMPLQGGAPIVLVKLTGGQGTINVPSWSPDSLRLAYVRYQPVASR